MYHLLFIAMRMKNVMVFNIEFIPIAKNENDFRNLLKQDNSDYLVDIRKSLTKNITLNKYLLNKCA